MAESWRAKANRYARGDFTNAELKVLLGGMLVDQVIDIATFGALSRLKGKAFKRMALPLIRKGVAGGARFLPAVARTAGMIALRHPYVAAGAAIYVGVTEREKIRALLEQGYEIVEERLPTPSLPSPGIPSPVIPGVSEIITSVRRPRTKRPSSFNNAIKQGMKVVKNAKTYGGKGNISPARKAFSVVVKLAAAKKKKKKAPKSGLRRRIWNAMKGLR